MIRIAFIYTVKALMDASLLQYYTYYITRKMLLQKLTKRNN